MTRFETHGLTGLRDLARTGRPATLNSTLWAALGRDLRREPKKFGHAGQLWDGKLLAAHLRLGYGVALGVHQCQRIFGHMEFRLHKPSPQVAQSDPVKVAAFKKNCIAWHGAGALNCGVWTNATSRNMARAAACGCRPRSKIPSCSMRPPVRRWPALRPSACAPARSSASCNTFNAATFATFLKTLLRHRARNTRMVLVLDNARYHHAILLKPVMRTYRAVLRLLFLPPYSPQLAPIERVWKRARRLATHNRFFATLADALTAISTCFDRWGTPNSVLGRQPMRHELRRYP